jgi:hypothetical protein
MYCALVHGDPKKMGETVQSYKLALDSEVRSWNGFLRALRSDDREAFEQLMDACRNYVSAGSNATRPVMFETMAMAIMLFQQKKLLKLEKDLNALKQHRTRDGLLF